MQFDNFITKRTIKMWVVSFIMLLGLVFSHISRAMDLSVPSYKAAEVSKKDVAILYEGEKKLYFYLPDQSVENLKSFLLAKKEFCTVLNPVVIARNWSSSDPEWRGKPWSDKNWHDNNYRLIHGVKDEAELEKCKQLYEQGTGQYLISKNLPIEELYHLCVARQLYSSYLKRRRSLEEILPLFESAKNIIKSFVLL